MAGTIGKSAIPDGFIHSKIYKIRGKNVMIDRDLAELYGVETRILNQAVKRHVNRFPEDFMFQMTTSEMEQWKSQIVISNRERMGLRKPPLVFTEQGVAMLSSVLNSEKAILVNIRIIRIFTKMRSLLESHHEILDKLERLEKKDIEQDEKIRIIFKILKILEKSRTNEPGQNARRNPVGFKQKGKH
jgi:hypothetical protein